MALLVIASKCSGWVADTIDAPDGEESKLGIGVATDSNLGNANYSVRREVEKIDV